MVGSLFHRHLLSTLSVTVLIQGTLKVEYCVRSFLFREIHGLCSQNIRVWNKDNPISCFSGCLSIWALCTQRHTPPFASREVHSAACTVQVVPLQSDLPVVQVQQVPGTWIICTICHTVVGPPTVWYNYCSRPLPGTCAGSISHSLHQKCKPEFQNFNIPGTCTSTVRVPVSM
jgi:hypothetical protein